MTELLQAHPQLACFLLAGGLGLLGLLELLILRSKGAAIATWVFAGFWLLAGLASVAGLGNVYNDYVGLLVVALVVIAGVVVLVKRLRA